MVEYVSAFSRGENGFGFKDMLLQNYSRALCARVEISSAPMALVASLSMGRHFLMRTSH